MNIHPRHLAIADYTYDLPDELIARHPLESRDSSRLLVFNKGQLASDIFRQLPHYLPPGSMLVFNNSKVVEARLKLFKPTGGGVEIFALEPHKAGMDITEAMLTTGQIDYHCMVGGAAKWKSGQTLKGSFEQGLQITAERLSTQGQTSVVRLTWHPASLPFAQVLHIAGQIPLPPYLNRQPEATDKERYQTVYARHDGSVAAPTAGLHFTPQVLEQVKKAGHETLEFTLHVGAGTFLPVKAQTMQGHQMHAEYMALPLAGIKQLATHKGPVIPVGTTSMRTLESIYWMGVKAAVVPSISEKALELSQWEVYDQLLQYAIPAHQALGALAQWMEQKNMEKLIIKTQIMIAPGYRFGICNGLITNFHQPQSTLLLLVAAFIGPAWRSVYHYALQNRFRFLSYGDSSLLLP